MAAERRASTAVGIECSAKWRDEYRTFECCVIVERRALCQLTHLKNWDLKHYINTFKLDKLVTLSITILIP